MVFSNKSYIFVFAFGAYQASKQDKIKFLSENKADFDHS